jgi:hypothetical protein
MCRCVIENDFQAVSPCIVALDHVYQRGNMGVDLEKCKKDPFGALDDRFIGSSLALVLRKTGHPIHPAVPETPAFSSWATRA